MSNANILQECHARCFGRAFFDAAKAVERREECVSGRIGGDFGEEGAADVREELAVDTSATDEPEGAVWAFAVELFQERCKLVKVSDML